MHPPRLLILGFVSLVSTWATPIATAQGLPSDLFPPQLMEDFARAKAAPRRSDLVIAFWFERHDPLGTFHHQVYDARKGEYTAAVDDWMGLMWRQYPDYVAYTRRVDVGRRELTDVVTETVANERGELAAALARRLTPARPFVGTTYSRGYEAWSRRPRAEPSAKPGVGMRRAPGDSGTSSLGPGPYPHPAPYLYPRPHP